MASSSLDEYRQMDEKYGDQMEKLFGPTLLGFPEDVDSSRLYMMSSNVKQILTLLNPDVPHVMTGYENTIGAHNKAFKQMDGTWEVKAILQKFGTNDVYMMVLYNAEKDLYDMVEKQVAENLTEKFGYAYNTKKMDSLHVGDTITDEVIYKTTSYDEHMNYRAGKNARVMYVTDNATIEDAIKLRKGWADTVQTVEVDCVEVSINSNDILLNVYGDADTYKTFPNIGEMVDDCTVCAVRRVNLNHILYDFQEKMLQTITDTDTEYVTSKNSIIYDMDIYFNGEGEFPDNIFYSQLKHYYEMECKYADDVTAIARSIKQSGSKYTPNVSYYKAKYQKFTNKEYKWKNKDKAFANLIVKFKTKAVLTLEEGFKLTGRYGDKGIISQISDCDKLPVENMFQESVNSLVDLVVDEDAPPEVKDKLAKNIAIVDDCDMPYLEDGTKVDILLNSSGAIRRLNCGQLYEVEINFIGENLQRYIKTLPTLEEKTKVIFRFLELLNKDQYNFFFTMYQSYDRIEKIGSVEVELLDRSAQEKFVADIEENGFYIVKRPDSHIRYDALRKLYDEWPWIKPYDAYIDLFGIKKKKIMRPVIIGSKYMYLLKQTSNKNFSARSTGRLDKKGLPAKSNDKKTNLAPFNTNPLKIGELYNLMAAVTGLDMAEYNIFMRSSPIGRKSLKRILEADGNPFDIKKLTIRNNFINQNAVILNAYMKAIGISLDFVTDDQFLEMYCDGIHEMEIRGHNVIDKLSRKKAYELLFDKYLEYMETHKIETTLYDKQKAAWDWVFADEDVKKSELHGLRAEDLFKITTNETPKKLLNPGADVSDDDDATEEETDEETDDSDTDDLEDTH